MRYELIDGVEATAQFSWKNDLHYRYRLEIILKDVAPTVENSLCDYAKSELCGVRRGRQVQPPKQIRNSLPE